MQCWCSSHIGIARRAMIGILPLTMDCAKQFVECVALGNTEGFAPDLFLDPYDKTRWSLGRKTRRFYLTQIHVVWSLDHIPSRLENEQIDQDVVAGFEIESDRWWRRMKTLPTPLVDIRRKKNPTADRTAKSDPVESEDRWSRRSSQKMPLSFLQNIYNETVNDVLLKLWKRESRRVYCSVGAHHHKLVLQKVRTVPEITVR